MDCIFQKTIFIGNDNAKLFFDFQNMRKRSCFEIVCRVSGLQRILGWSGRYVRLPIRLCLMMGIGLIWGFRVPVMKK